MPQLTEEGKRYIDKSVTYDNDESGLVVDVKVSLSGEAKFVMVTFEYDRPMYIGDKMSMTHDHDVLTDRGWIPVADVTLKDKVACLSEGKYLKYQHPIRVIDYEYEGEMYELKSQHLSLNVTANHKMWVSRRKSSATDVKYRDYEFIAAKDVHGKRVKYQKDTENVYPDIDTYKGFAMDSWLKLLGMWISDGFTRQSKGSNRVEITAIKERKLRFIRDIYNELNVEYREDSDRIVTTNPIIYKVLAPLSVGALNKYLPDYVWQVSQRQARILLDSLVEGDGNRQKNQRSYYTSSIRLRDDIMRLCLHAGYSGTYTIHTHTGQETTIHGRVVRSTADNWRIGINVTKNRPEINNGHSKQQNAQSERLYETQVTVYCLEVPEHVFYIRRNGKACWTGNSSRAGNKTILGLILPETDMPHTMSGLRPDMILNPHSLPHV